MKKETVTRKLSRAGDLILEKLADMVDWWSDMRLLSDLSIHSLNAVPAVRTTTLCTLTSRSDFSVVIDLHLLLNFLPTTSPCS
jgi:hypothetical protein